MGRPLKALYANTTYSNGVKEMSDSDIGDIITPVLLTYIVANPTLALETYLRFNLSGYTNAVSRGVIYDYRNGNIGEHPQTNTVINIYTLNQSEVALTPAPAVRPVHYVLSGGEHQIKEMSNSDIFTYIVAPVVQTMITGGQGAYSLGLTSSGAPATGTWTSVSTLYDSYYNSSSVLANTSYTLWQRTTGTAIGTIRPLKAINGGVKEMTNAEIEGLYTCIGEYIRTTSIGQYAIQTTAPASGTWISRGSFADNINVLTGVAYTGAYVGAYSGTYSGTYTGSYTSFYSGTYSRYFSGTYSRYFSGAYSGSYTGYYAGSRNNNYVNPYNGVTYTGNYATNYSGAYAGSYTGYYLQGTYSGSYLQGTYIGGYAQAYSGSYVGNYTGSYSGTYTGYYAGLTTQTTLATITSTLYVRTA